MAAVGDEIMRALYALLHFFSGGRLLTDSGVPSMLPIVFFFLFLQKKETHACTIPRLLSIIIQPLRFTPPLLFGVKHA